MSPLSPPRPSPILRGAAIIVVSVYLSLVLLFLLISGRIPGAGQWFRALFRRRYRADLATIDHERGRCFIAPVPEWLTSDSDGVSRLVVLEDGRALPLGHAAHEDIRSLGCGRYSHWGPSVYFSPSDGTDPRTNGRRYSVSEQAFRKGQPLTHPHTACLDTSASNS